MNEKYFKDLMVTDVFPMPLDHAAKKEFSNPRLP
jgi:hypothetical protein